MPYLIARKGLKVVCISYTVESEIDLFNHLHEGGCTFEPSDIETYLNKGMRMENGSIVLIQTISVDSNTWKIKL